eukprot:96427_1
MSTEFVHNALHRKELITFGYTRDFSLSQKLTHIIIPTPLLFIIAKYLPTDYQTEWSQQYKHPNMKLSNNNCTVTYEHGFNSIRAKDPITIGMIAYIKFEIFFTVPHWNFIGVSTSNCFPIKKHWDDMGFTAKNASLDNCYGIDSENCGIYKGQNEIAATWKPQLKTDEEIEIKMIVDYTKDNGLLFFYLNNCDELLAPPNQSYTMKLPKLSANENWYPVITLNPA